MLSIRLPHNMVSETVSERQRIAKRIAREQRKKMLKPLFAIAKSLVADHVKSFVVTRPEVQAYLTHLHDEWNLQNNVKIFGEFPFVKEEWTTPHLEMRADTIEWEGDDWCTEFISEAGMDESSDSDSDSNS